jgi:tetratricopeptide (TPR) repeat protein
MKKSILLLCILLFIPLLQGCTDSRRADSYKVQADKYLEEEDYKNAIIYYDKALEISPEKVGVLGGKAKALEALGKYDEAIKECDKAIKINPHWLMYITQKAMHFLKNRNLKVLWKINKAAFKLDPENA